MARQQQPTALEILGVVRRGADGKSLRLTPEAVLAQRRYPCEPVDLALMQFASDRRAAGLGALDQAKRSSRSGGSWHGVRCSKFIDPINGRLHYSRCVNLPARWVSPEFDPEECYPGATVAETTVTVQPARKVERWATFDGHDLRSQAGRTCIARMLRKLRREMFAVSA